jgi:hypothetical protein
MRQHELTIADKESQLRELLQKVITLESIIEKERIEKMFVPNRVEEEQKS